MTIISSVYVPEGIILSADSRLTGHRNHGNGIVDRFTISDNTQKILLLKNSEIGVNYCGDAIIDGKTIADFLRVFDIDKVEKNDSIEDVTIKLHNYLKKAINSIKYFLPLQDTITMNLMYMLLIKMHILERIYRKMEK
ncbi:hypothetical protein ACQCVP_11885 [Rossellomorea vietnamensis]|uniref:hypothetical protein n=1 Tax=Rossellomorea vietnamensis TaxID=218284 RepID=UPI003CF19D9F